MNWVAVIEVGFGGFERVGKDEEHGGGNKSGL